MDGERVPHLVDGVGQQHASLLGEFAYGQLRTLLLILGHACYFLVGGFGQVQQHQDGEVPGLAHAAHHDARVRLIAQADVGEAGDGGVDVDLVAVLQLADALHALGLHGVQQELHAVDFPLVPGGDGVDDRQVAGLGALLQHRGPGRTLQLDLVVPLGIVEGVGHRFLAFQLVEGLAVALVADVLVGEQLGAQHPDFLGVVAGGFHIDLVGHFHDADVLAHLLERFVAGARRLVEIEFLEFPEIAVVVAVRRGEHIGPWIEGDLLVGQAVGQLHADFPGCVVAVQPVPRVGEQDAAFGDPRVVVLVGFVEQGAGQAVEVVADAGVHCRRGGVQPGPQLFQAWEPADRQRFDAGILDHRDQRHLQGVEGFGGNGLPRFDHVSGAVGGGGAIEFQAGDSIPLSLRERGWG